MDATRTCPWPDELGGCSAEPYPGAVYCAEHRGSPLDETPVTVEEMSIVAAWALRKAHQAQDVSGVRQLITPVTNLMRLMHDLEREQVDTNEATERMRRDLTDAGLRLVG